MKKLSSSIVMRLGFKCANKPSQIFLTLSGPGFSEHPQAGGGGGGLN